MVSPVYLSSTFLSALFGIGCGKQTEYEQGSGIMGLYVLDLGNVWTVCVVRTQRGDTHVGVTRDLVAYLYRASLGYGSGAFAKRGLVTVIHSEEFRRKSGAMKRRRQLNAVCAERK